MRFQLPTLTPKLNLPLRPPSLGSLCTLGSLGSPCSLCTLGSLGSLCTLDALCSLGSLCTLGSPGRSCEKPISIEECIVWARNRFEELYHNQILQLLHNFPIDMLTSTGTPFWSGPKRPPTAFVFDSANELHLDYITSCANLRAFNYGLKGTVSAHTRRVQRWKRRKRRKRRA